MTYINTTYKPQEIEAVQKELKAIIDIWNAAEKKDESKTLENWIILALHKHSYRIVKTGKQ